MKTAFLISGTVLAILLFAHAGALVMKGMELRIEAAEVAK